MTPDEIQQARAYVYQHRYDLASAAIRGDERAASVIAAWHNYYNNQHDTQAQTALVEAVSKHREGSDGN